MIKFREWLREQEEKELALLEMAPTFYPEDTGLKEFIWVSTKLSSHGPRIKVYITNPPSKNFSVTISDNPKVVAGDCFVNNKELKKIFDFVIKHKDNLIGYWNSELTSKELEHNLFDV